jgi:hypothetical protein
VAGKKAMQTTYSYGEENGSYSRKILWWANLLVGGHRKLYGKKNAGYSDCPTSHMQNSAGANIFERKA